MILDNFCIGSRSAAKSSGFFIMKQTGGLNKDFPDI